MLLRKSPGLPAVHDDGAGASSVALIHLPEENEHTQKNEHLVTFL